MFQQRKTTFDWACLFYDLENDRPSEDPILLMKIMFCRSFMISRAMRKPWKPSAGDPDARFQRGKHDKPSELGYEAFFSTDGKQLFVEDVQVSAEASQGQQLFLDK